MQVKVLFFGLLRDVTGQREAVLALPEGSTAGDAFDHFALEFPRMTQLAPSIMIAVNQQFASRNQPLAEQDELAFLPPVSGGSGTRWTHQVEDPDGHFFGLTRDPIRTAEIAARLLRGEDGAIVHFEGVVRNNTKGRKTRYLDYECYEPMAIRLLSEIGRDIAARYEVGRVALVHRLGRLQIGEASVAVVVCSPHRRAAFEAALEGINRLKKLVPIWKKEYFEDGEVWVEGEWDESLLPR